MSYVATLISAPQRPAVTETLAARVAEKLPQARLGNWLHPGVAIDIVFDDPPDKPGATTDLLKKLTHELRGVIGQECIDELADYAGFKDRVAAITERAMRGELAFAPALRERVALLRGLPASTIDKVIAERIRPNPGAAVLVKTMRAHGAYTCVVTGGFTAFMAPLAAAIGFDEYHANTLLTDGAGRLTGEVAEPVLGREAKCDTLLALRQRLRLRREDTLAVGDGANDVPMIEAAGLGIAFHAKPALREAADACIDHGDLTALLYAQGYGREDFVEAA